MVVIIPMIGPSAAYAPNPASGSPLARYGG